MAVSQHIWHCGAGLPGDVLITDLRAYRGPHFHDAWSIGAIDYGACAHRARCTASGSGRRSGRDRAGRRAYRRHVRNAAGLPHAAWSRPGSMTTRALLGAAAAFDGPVIRRSRAVRAWLAALAPEGMDEGARRAHLGAVRAARARARPGRWRPRTRMSATSCARAWRGTRPARRTWRRWPGAGPRTTLVSSSRVAMAVARPGCNWRVARARRTARRCLLLVDAAHAVGPTRRT